ncbi:MAG: radical SAM protein [Eubacterium aggregans]
MSDPSNTQEQKFKLTQAALELLDRYHFGVAIATKSDLITRDIPVLQSIAHHSPVLCKITLTTVSDTLAAKVEPRAPSPTQRLKAIESLAKAGVFCGVLLMPVLPFIEDDAQAIAQLIESCASAGARFIYPAFGVTLRENQREWYFNALRQAFPHAHLPERYAKAFGNDYECHCPEANGLWFNFKSLCVQQNLLFNMSDIIRTYTSPYLSEQLNFFDL